MEMPGDCQKIKVGEGGVRDRETPGDCQKIRQEKEE